MPPASEMTQPSFPADEARRAQARVGDDDTRAVAAEQLGDGGAEAARVTGDDDDMAAQRVLGAVGGRRGDVDLQQVPALSM